MGKKRGAPPKPSDQLKTVIFPIRMTIKEREIVSAAGGKKPSAWARKMLLNAALKATNKRKAGESNPSA
jgi:hypothetical protein